MFTQTVQPCRTIQVLVLCAWCDRARSNSNATCVPGHAPLLKSTGAKLDGNNCTTYINAEHGCHRANQVQRGPVCASHENMHDIRTLVIEERWLEAFKPVYTSEALRLRRPRLFDDCQPKGPVYLARALSLLLEIEPFLY